MKKKIIFITSSRADYGKIKPLLKAIEGDDLFDLYIFVTGMHNLEKLVKRENRGSKSYHLRCLSPNNSTPIVSSLYLF